MSTSLPPADIPSMQGRAKAAFLQGIEHYRQLRLTEAIASWESALHDFQGLIDAGHGKFRAETAATRANLGNALSQAGRLDDAMAQYEVALGNYQGLIDAGHGKFRAAAATTRGGLGNALSNAGRLDDAMAQYEAALRDIQGLIDAGHGQFRAEAATIRGNLGNTLSDAGRLDDAMAEFEAALREYQGLIDAGHEQFRANAAHARESLGNALSKAGLQDDAIVHYEAALRDYQGLIDAGHGQFRAEVASTRGNLGNALLRAGRLDEAMGQYEAALRDNESLIDAGHTQFRANAARIRTNLGSALLTARRLGEATAQIKAELSELLGAIDADHGKIRANEARTRGNLGTALSGAGGLGDVVAQFKAALNDQRGLIDAGLGKFRANVGRKRDNLGTALSGAGRSGDAMIQQYEAALRDYQGLIDAGLGQYRAEAATTRGNLGNALSDAGRLDDALAQYEAALSDYQGLIDVGQWQHVADWYRLNELRLETGLGRVRQLEELFIETPALTAEMQRAQVDIERQLADWAHWAGQPAFDPRSDAMRIAVLRRALAALTDWQAERPRFGTTGQGSAAVALVATSLDLLAKLMTEGSLQFVLNRYDSDIAPMAQALLACLLQLDDASAVAHWHLRTQGLRAQLQAQQDSLLVEPNANPDLARLMALRQQLNQLANEASGSTTANLLYPNDQRGDGGFTTDMLLPTPGSGFMVGAVGLETRSPPASKVDAYEKIRREQYEPLLAKLQSESRIPDLPLLDLGHIRRALQQLNAQQQEESALLLLVPLPPHSGEDASRSTAAGGTRSTRGQDLIVVSVRIAADGQSMRYRRHHVWAEHSGQDVVDHWDRINAHARALAQSGVAMKGGTSPMRGGMRTVTLDTAGPDRLTDAEYRAKLNVCLDAPKVLLPLLAELRAEGVCAAHIVPGGDLHMVPWAASLDQQVSGLAVRQFPTAAGWWRVVDEEEHAAKIGAHATRWASLCSPAVHSCRPLIWVGVEQAAVRQIWSAVVPIDDGSPQWPIASTTGEPVQALMAMGHGDAPDDNWAQAGLLLADGSYLTANRLYAIQHARRLVMSCCVVGQVRAASGEPLGMTALAFGFKTRMAVGASTLIPDFEGMLFSLALHHAWANAEAERLSKGQRLDWSGVFHSVRRDVVGGRWPVGFGAWLSDSLVSLLDCGDGEQQQRLAYLMYSAGNTEMEGGISARLAALAEKPSAVVAQVAAVMTCLG